MVNVDSACSADDVCSAVNTATSAPLPSATLLMPSAAAARSRLQTKKGAQAEVAADGEADGKPDADKGAAEDGQHEQLQPPHARAARACVR